MSISRFFSLLGETLSEAFTALFVPSKCGVCNRYIEGDGFPTDSMFGKTCSSVCRDLANAGSGHKSTCRCYVCNAPIEPGTAIPLKDPHTGRPYGEDMVACSFRHVGVFQEE